MPNWFARKVELMPLMSNNSKLIAMHAEHDESDCYNVVVTTRDHDDPDVCPLEGMVISCEPGLFSQDPNCPGMYEDGTIFCEHILVAFNILGWNNDHV